jgi:hypothetical protein
MARTSRALRASVKVSMTAAGKVAKREVESSGRPFTGGDLKFSNMGGARISVRPKVVESGVLVSPKGPWGLLQPGRRPGPGKHPGTRNTFAWDKGRGATFEAVESELPRKIGSDVERAF